MVQEEEERGALVTKGETLLHLDHLHPKVMNPYGGEGDILDRSQDDLRDMKFEPPEIEGGLDLDLYLD